MQTIEDSGLLAAAQAGDERAYRALVEPHRRAIEVHCYRMLGSLADAEDVAQETLLRAWRSLERFERRSTIHTWLYRIATNACLDELERRPRRPEPVVDPYPDDRLSDAAGALADPAARYALREGMEHALLTAIQLLPGRQRAVLILRDVLGWTGPEVADLLESTIASVNSALQRARATVDGALGPRASGAGERELLRRYVAAWEAADIDGLVSLLRDDAVLTMPPQADVIGAEAAVAFMWGNCGGRASAHATWHNRQPAVVLREPDGTVHRTLLLDVADEAIVALHAFSG